MYKKVYRCHEGIRGTHIISGPFPIFEDLPHLFPRLVPHVFPCEGCKEPMDTYCPGCRGKVYWLSVFTPHLSPAKHLQWASCLSSLLLLQNTPDTLIPSQREPVVPFQNFQCLPIDGLGRGRTKPQELTRQHRSQGGHPHLES